MGRLTRLPLLIFFIIFSMGVGIAARVMLSIQEPIELGLGEDPCLAASSSGVSLLYNQEDKLYLRESSFSSWDAAEQITNVTVTDYDFVRDGSENIIAYVSNGEIYCKTSNSTAKISSGSGCSHPRLTIANDYLFVVWSKSSSVFCRWKTENGWQPIQDVSLAATNPEIAADSSAVYVVYESSSNIGLRMFDLVGGWTDPITIGSGTNSQLGFAQGIGYLCLLEGEQLVVYSGSRTHWDRSATIINDVVAYDLDSDGDSLSLVAENADHEILHKSRVEAGWTATVSLGYGSEAATAVSGTTFHTVQLLGDELIYRLFGEQELEGEGAEPKEETVPQKMYPDVKSQYYQTINAVLEESNDKIRKNLPFLEKWDDVPVLNVFHDYPTQSLIAAGIIMLALVSLPFLIRGIKNSGRKEIEQSLED
ncbi:MAG: hypothetical protein GF308_02405 [Candidatus Heimdallarchaeota archaeon]|nr:hypothetical protein [Candidatus Heimdallarchaeota archaeon]